ncbi:hypothetical protein pb186bvf_004100 [Paramecium bursaria]
MVWIFIIIGQSFAVDYCKQLDSFELCIGSTLSECRWNTNFQQCVWSNNYLYGCERTLNKNLCLNQIGNLRTGDCYCIFNNECQEVEDFKKISCSDPLNRGACLSVTKEKEYCEWDNECIQLNDEKEFIQNNFTTRLFSKSVCTQIENYMIMNSFLLQNKLNIQNDLISEAENKISDDFKPEVSNYDEGALLNNFADSDGNFIWFRQGYQYNEKKKIALNDPNRYGCIAVDIPDDTVYKQLFSLGEEDIIYGVNHVYCFELEFSMATTDTEGKEQSDKKVTYFKDDACHIIKQNLLQDVEYIRANNIQCKNLGKVGCLSIKKQCILKKYSQIEQPMPQEFPCDDYKSSDSQQAQTFSYFECAKTDLNYMDLSSIEAPCFNISSSENSPLCSRHKLEKECIAQKDCTFLATEALAEKYAETFIFCSPQQKCNQFGLSKIYCNKLYDTCYWNEQTTSCEYFGDRLLYSNCKDANTVFTCTQLRKIDQHCAWLDNECRNIRFEHLLSHFLSFDPKTFMNRNLCFYQDGPYEWVDNMCQKIEKYEDFRCDKLPEEITTSTQQCTSRQINKYACLNIREDPTVWLPYYQQCSRYTLLELPVCDLTILVSPNVCMIAKVSDNKLCLHIEDSCQSVLRSQHQIKCSDPGLRKEDCLKVTTPGQYCQWRFARCNEMKREKIFYYRCHGMVKVNPQSCSAFSVDINCLYDEVNQSCYAKKVVDQGCKEDMSPKTCQENQDSCYYNWVQLKCLPTTPEILNLLDCENGYISEKACKSVTTPGKACVWEDQCFDFTYVHLAQCEIFESMNRISCSQLTSLPQNYWDFDMFCQYNDLTQKCEANNEQIDGCGENLQINAPRCAAYTTGNCFFLHSHCREIKDQNYLDYVLNRVQCENINMKLCTKVTNPQQACELVQDVDYELKCREALFLELTCDKIDFSQNKFNNMICSQALDYCSFTDGKCVTTMPYLPCDYPALSKRSCIEHTYGNCVFDTMFCRYYDYREYQCEQLNMGSCLLFSGSNGCMYDIDKNQCLPIPQESQDQIIEFDNKQFKSFYSFKPDKSQQQYYSIDKLSSGIQNLPCWWIQDKVSCFSQQKICQYADGQCMDILTQCELAKTFNQCMVVQNPCIYTGFKCQTPPLEEIDKIPSNYFQCMKLGKIYDSKHRCRNYKQIVVAKQISYEEPDPLRDICTVLIREECLFQRYAPCIWDQTEDKCKTIPKEKEQTKCNAQAALIYNSILACGECHFFGTNSGLSVCLEIPELTCSALTVENCSFDFELTCYHDGTNCATFDPKSNINLEGVVANWNACMSKGLYFNKETGKCQTSNYNQISACSEAQNQIDCAILTQQSCQVAYGVQKFFAKCLDGNSKFVTGQAQGNFILTNNMYQCVLLTDDAYYFNIQEFKCLKYDITHLFVNSCKFLNNKSCQIYEERGCLFDEKGCREPENIESKFQCSQANQILCFTQRFKSCQWTNQICQDYQAPTKCQGSQVSVLGCQNATDVPCGWQFKNCVQIQQTYFHDCFANGFNRDACLYYTERAFCYWEQGTCKPANFIFQLCSDDVSQETCLSIVTDGQVCQWDDQKKKCQQYVGQICSDYSQFNQNGCDSAPMPCYYDKSTKLCVEIPFERQDCAGGFNQLALYEIKYETCYIELYQETDYEPPLTCNFIINIFGCVNSPMICSWDVKKKICSDFTKEKYKTCLEITLDQTTYLSKGACQFASKDKCQFENGKCDYKIRDADLSFINNIDQSKYEQPLLEQDCPYFTTRTDCINVISEDQSCEWNKKEQKCQQSQQKTCNDQNLLACISNKQEDCAWRGLCIMWDQKLVSVELDNSILTSVTTCSKIQIELPLQYKKDSCHSFQPQSICEEPNINREGCISVDNKCTFRNYQCVEYKDEKFSECSQYTNISENVCRSLPNLACKFDKGTCTMPDYTQDKCSTKGISQKACSSITTEACYWNGSRCLNFIPDIFKDQCDGSFTSNALSCQLMNYKRIACAFDSQTNKCSKQVNFNQGCSVTGLNRYGCFQMRQQACEFGNNKCAEVSSNNCHYQLNVNELACKSNQEDSCQYIPEEYSCQIVFLKPPCNTPGLNERACQQNDICKFSSTDQQCKCGTHFDDECNILTQDSCIQSSLCTWKTEVCVRKHCQDLITDCSGQLMDAYCYKDKYGVCLGASSCEQIVHMDSTYKCTDYQFNGSQCIQIKDYCVSENNLDEICADAIAGQQCKKPACILDQRRQFCRKLQCSDYNQASCQQNSNCIWKDKQCQQFYQCGEIEDGDVCNTLVANRQQCQWGQYKIMDPSKLCTNDWCDVFGASYTICNGNEVNGATCILNSAYQCKMCESITDECTCNNSNNACEYVNNRCVSVQCKKFYSFDTCSISRCYWSVEAMECRKVCIQNVLKEQCDDLSDDCHWDTYTNTCKQGKELMSELKTNNIQLQI